MKERKFSLNLDNKIMQQCSLMWTYFLCGFSGETKTWLSSLQKKTECFYIDKKIATIIQILKIS